MTTLSPEQIAYAVKWLRSGNDWRRMPPVPWTALRQMRCPSPEADDFYCLNSAGLTIAKMAIALEQANATAEVASGAGRRYACLPETIELASIETMRANKKEFLG